MISHLSPEYKELRSTQQGGKWNGAFYYSQEIVKNIIPNVKTNRPWNTLGMQKLGAEDGSIIFLHNNAYPWKYSWLKDYKDLVLVCNNQYTADSVKYYGKVIMLPLSVDVDYVSKFKTEKTKGTCFAGNLWAHTKKCMETPYVSTVTGKVDILTAMPRPRILKELAKYEGAFAIGRMAIEAKVLGCKVYAYDPRYPDPNFWKVLDNKDAAKILQVELNKIGG